MYPNLLITFNIDRTTKLATALTIDGIEQSQHEDIFSNAADTSVNAVWLGSTYFGLPNYTQLLEAFDNQKVV
jgi:hypothetical protein